MTRVLIPFCLMIIAICGTTGPDEPVTGKSATIVLLMGLLSFIGVRLGDWFFDHT